MRDPSTKFIKSGAPNQVKRTKRANYRVKFMNPSPKLQRTKFQAYKMRGPNLVKRTKLLKPGNPIPVTRAKCLKSRTPRPVEWGTQDQLCAQEPLKSGKLKRTTLVELGTVGPVKRTRVCRIRDPKASEVHKMSKSVTPRPVKQWYLNQAP